MVVGMKVIVTFNKSDHIEYMGVGGRRNRGRQEQCGAGDQGGR